MQTQPSPYDTYTSPLATRNASKRMLHLWSAKHKFNTWRRIWLAVAQAQHEITKDQPKPLVTKEQVEELRSVVERKNPDGSVGITDDEIRLAEKYERELRHDVMSHVHALGDACPKAKGIIHLGMTSQDVVCNADNMIWTQSLKLIFNKLARGVISLSEIAHNYRHLPTLGFTHYQPAQPVTVGRRCASWAYELYVCFDRVKPISTNAQFRSLRGLRGATGTQASYLELFEGRGDLVDRLEAGFLFELFHWDWQTSPWINDELMEAQRTGCIEGYLHLAKMLQEQNCDTGHADKMSTQADSVKAMSIEQYRAFDARMSAKDQILTLTGQTYPRVIDTFILADLASVACVLHKIATDIRLLCNRKELDEPFEDKQIGSSAMPYKRNPMRCERICGLARFVMNLVGNAYDTAATQWLERTLDDSSNRRLSLPEAFLALDGALDLMHNVASGLIVHEAMVKKNLMAELPFMATENILMACVKLGGDRQEYHEFIRVHAQAAGLRVKQQGLDNDLLDRLKADPHFQSASRGGKLSAELDWDSVMDPMKYIGRSVEQTERFIKEVVEPLREHYKDELAELDRDDNAPRV